MEFDRLVQALMQPEAYPEPADVTRLETHISVLFFAGQRVYKLKKPVDLGFVDFTRIDDRRHYCEEEVRLNRRLASEVYVGVKPVTLDGDRVRIGGSGETIGHVVEMHRLPEVGMLDRRLDDGAIDNQVLGELATIIASFHRNADTGVGVDGYGTPEAVADIVLGNLDEMEPLAAADDSTLVSESSPITAGVLEYLHHSAERFLEEERELFERRVTEGRIRDGHGDLHAANICVTPHGLVIYDCLEFAPRFRCADVAADIAFLAMDLDLRCFRGFSRYLIYRYLERTWDRELPRLLDFYKTHRALVRAKVTGLRARGSEDPDARLEATLEGMRYSHLAASYWLPPSLILTCGLPATGKSWASRQLARPFEAVVARSDVIRRQLRHEVRDRGHGIDEGLYQERFKRQVYTMLLDEVVGRIEAGRTVIIDATFSTAAWRRSFLDLARDRRVPYVVVHLTCSEEIIQERFRRRQRDRDEVSEADLEVYRSLQRVFEPPDEVDAVHRLDAEAPIEGEELAAGVIERLVRQVRSPAPIAQSGEGH